VLNILKLDLNIELNNHLQTLGLFYLSLISANSFLDIKKFCSKKINPIIILLIITFTHI
jgi:hypothetical protein